MIQPYEGARPDSACPWSLFPALPSFSMALSCLWLLDFCSLKNKQCRRRCQKHRGPRAASGVDCSGCTSESFSPKPEKPGALPCFSWHLPCPVDECSLCFCLAVHLEVPVSCLASLRPGLTLVRGPPCPGSPESTWCRYSWTSLTSLASAQRAVSPPEGSLLTACRVPFSPCS